MPERRANRGFTLLEVLLVFVIFALVLAIVPPYLPNVLAGAEARTAARDLAASLKKTRQLAISAQQEAVLSLDVAQKTYAVNGRAKKLTMPDHARLTIITARSERLSAERGRIRFFADGSSTGGQIKLAWKQQEYVIDVHWLTGAIKIRS